ncbi:ATP-binding protein [candidate division KSB1 bacterium]|nr:ATP-binding protein [candidate division KSB1 bacterium]NIR70798.1 ATP-binding protein [candidate division KSB1 bacterium]NIS27811.1 ATP-binding protein [candidate division KSB1 bacterium]NIT74693.1 ATP-binding protein [candidate division KSB1 bacterium]NIU28478.1 ATP-binding protein [candidate division KSB1 bacterium]
MEEVEIRLPSDPRLLKIVRCGVSHLCEICGFSKGEKNQVVLAVDEAASNIIKHTYQNDTDKPIVISYRIFDDRLEVVLRDFGNKADPKKIKPRDLEDVKPGGLGVHFIKSTMDQVRYDNTLDVGNQVTLMKYLPGKKESR